jgi:uncharacterized protein YndB with AHSA1/START domain
VGTNTIRLHRVFRTTPERIYRSFLDGDAMTKWLPPNGFTGKVHHMYAKVGGTFKMSFTNFTTGRAIHSADNISSSCRMNGFATRTTSTIRTYREKFA